MNETSNIWRDLTTPREPVDEALATDEENEPVEELDENEPWVVF